MTMLAGYQFIRRFFERFAWWETEPHDELVTGEGAQCLARPGEIYAAYLPEGGSVLLRVTAGVYEARSYNPQTGEWRSLPDVSGGEFRGLLTSKPRDAAVLLTRRE